MEENALKPWRHWSGSVMPPSQHTALPPRSSRSRNAGEWGEGIALQLQSGPVSLLSRLSVAFRLADQARVMERKDTEKRTTETRGHGHLGKALPCHRRVGYKIWGQWEDSCIPAVIIAWIAYCYAARNKSLCLPLAPTFLRLHLNAGSQVVPAPSQLLPVAYLQCCCPRQGR